MYMMLFVHRVMLESIVYTEKTDQTWGVDAQADLRLHWANIILLVLSFSFILRSF